MNLSNSGLASVRGENPGMWGEWMGIGQEAECAPAPF